MSKADRILGRRPGDTSKADRILGRTGDGFSRIDSEELSNIQLICVYNHCMKIYPERFFDIIYQNEQMFDDVNINTCFLPNIDFKVLFKSDGISDNTRKIMWNYLKLILLTIVGSVKDKSIFGDTNALFNDIDEDKLLSTLTETMSSMSDFFSETEKNDNVDEGKPIEKENENGLSFDIPNVEDVFGHLKGLFDGKIGTLVKELAEEISGDLADVLGKENINDVRSTKDVIEKLMKNPKKVTDLFKTINNKLQGKLQTGEISQDELLKEVSEIMAKMKGGKDDFDFQEILNNMTGGGGITDMINKMKGMFQLNRKANNNNDETEHDNSKKLCLHEKMKNRMLIKKTQIAKNKLKEEQRIIEASKNFVPYDELSFTIDGEEKQHKSTAPKKKIKNPRIKSENK
jgi:hypothetical protein